MNPYITAQKTSKIKNVVTIFKIRFCPVTALHCYGTENAAEIAEFRESRVTDRVTVTSWKRAVAPLYRENSFPGGLV